MTYTRIFDDKIKNSLLLTWKFDIIALVRPCLLWSYWFVRRVLLRSNRRTLYRTFVTQWTTSLPFFTCVNTHGTSPVVTAADLPSLGVGVRMTLPGSVTDTFSSVDLE